MKKRLISLLLAFSMMLTLLRKKAGHRYSDIKSEQRWRRNLYHDDSRNGADEKLRFFVM